MSEWTTERFDALPEGTAIEWVDCGVELTAVKQEKGRWQLVRHTYYEYPEDIIENADPGSIRVVSVPIDVLLADEAVEQGLWAWVTSAAVGATRENVNPRVLDLNRHRAGAAIRAAVEHVTGGRHE